MNRLSLRNNRLELNTAGKSPILLEEFIEYTPSLIKENQRMSTSCNRLDLQTLARISTSCYAQKSPQSPGRRPGHGRGVNFFAFVAGTILGASLLFHRASCEEVGSHQPSGAMGEHGRTVDKGKFRGTR